MSMSLLQRGSEVGKRLVAGFHLRNFWLLGHRKFRIALFGTVDQAVKIGKHLRVGFRLFGFADNGWLGGVFLL